MTARIDIINQTQYVRTEKETCPICGKDNGTGRKIKGYLGDMLYITLCHDCQIMYQNPKPTPQATLAYMNSLWADKVRFDYVRENEAILRAREDMMVLNSVCPKPGKLLDFGAGIGAFTRVAMDDGWQVHGTERSDTAIKRAKDEFGIELMRDIPDEKYDAITLLDVIEHLRKPAEIVQILGNHLKIGGKLILSTGNYQSWPCLMLGDKWALFQMDHLFFFTPQSLKSLLENCGLSNFQLLTDFNQRLPNLQNVKNPITYIRQHIARNRAHKLWPGIADYEVMVAVATRTA
jgi:2-polyprenyl-3-methyl-5-hydroxy-6-metoxy-1,4-benzoquinol methylase